jgi:hypothetical protein
MAAPEVPSAPYPYSRQSSPRSSRNHPAAASQYRIRFHRFSFEQRELDIKKQVKFLNAGLE